MKTTLAVVVVAAGFLLAARPTVAHHAFSAEFDANNPGDAHLRQLQVFEDEVGTFGLWFRRVCKG